MSAGKNSINIKTSKKSLKIKIASVNKQAGFDDCGVFAAAYCTALVKFNGQDPSTLVYDFHEKTFRAVFE